MNIELKPVNTPEEIGLLCRLAKEAWEQAYSELLGLEQVEYMVEKFLSPPAVREQMDKEGYIYYLIYGEGEPGGFTGFAAVTVIEYTGARAEEGYSPDGKKIDTTELYATSLVAQAMKKLDIDVTQATADSICMNIHVEPVITEEDLLVQQAKLDNGEKDYELNPTRYVVSFSCGVSSGKEYPRMVLNQILSISLSSFAA